MLKPTSSHLGSEDADTVHPQQSTRQTFTKMCSNCIYPHSSTACCCRQHPLAVCPPLFQRSITLSLPFLVPSPPALSEQPAWTPLLQQRPTTQHGSFPRCNSSVCSFPVAAFGLRELVATFDLEDCEAQKIYFQLSPGTLSSIYSLLQKSIHVDAQVNTRRHGMCTHKHMYIRKISYMNTPLSPDLSGLWQGWGV